MRFFEELLFAIDKRVNVVRSEFKSVPMRDRVGWACLYTIPAENASRIIDVVNLGVALTGGNPVRVLVFGGFDINAIRRARGRTQKAAYALFQAILVAVQYVNPSVARLEVYRLVRIILRDGLPEDIAKGHAEALYQRAECLAHFPNDRWHKLKV